MAKPIATAKVQLPLNQAALIERLKQAAKDDREEVPITAELTQSHYYVKGSLDERMAAIRQAFRVYNRARPNGYGYTLAVFEDSIIFYENDWVTDDTTYWRLPYTVDGANIVTFGTPVQVNVDVVVDALSEGVDVGDPDEQSAVTPEATAEQTMTATSPEEQAAAPVDTPKEETPKPEVIQATVVPTSEGAELLLNQAAVEPAADGKVIYQGIALDSGTLIQGSTHDAENKSLSRITQAKSTDGKHMKLQGVATIGNILSANGVVYPTSVWTKNLDQMNEAAKAGKFIGKVEHPDVEQGLKDVAIKYDSFTMQGDNVLFEATVVQTQEGKNLQAMIDAGIVIDISSRGYGTIKQGKWNGKDTPIVQDDFVNVAFDAVWHGASTGSSVTNAQYQSAGQPPPTPPAKEKEIIMEKTAEELAQEAAAKRSEAIIQSAQFAATRKGLLAQSALTGKGQELYQSRLNAVADGDMVELLKVHDANYDTISELFTQSVADAGTSTLTQGVTHAPNLFFKQSQEAIAPKTVGEMIDRIVTDYVPDKENLQSFTAGNKLTDTRAQIKAVLQNMARSIEPGFNGNMAALGMLAMAQGRIDTANDILTQSYSSDAVSANGNADPGGAPLSSPMIFPLVTRVFVKLILNEIASIQPMDRPDGKIFYLDQLRASDPGNGGVDTRIDLASSNPFTSSFADNNTEGAAPAMVKLRLTSTSVRAYAKKLGYEFSVEEMQDLRAYHSLDAATILMDGAAKEMAMEWNYLTLNDMLSQATAGTLTYGTTVPATGGWTQEKWDSYIWVYLMKLENIVYGKRNGNITHLICGMDAALALSKSNRATFMPVQDSDDLDGPYPGTTFYGVAVTPGGSRYKVFKTNFWQTGTTNGSKILALRKGQEFGDTPYVFAPYTVFTTPTFVDPTTFSMKQGVMERAARKVVVSDAMAVLNIANGTVGVPL